MEYEKGVIWNNESVILVKIINLITIKFIKLVSGVVKNKVLQSKRQQSNLFDKLTIRKIRNLIDVKNKYFLLFEIQGV